MSRGCCQGSWEISFFLNPFGNAVTMEFVGFLLLQISALPDYFRREGRGWFGAYACEIAPL